MPNKGEKSGFMGHPDPWDIACLYRNAAEEWPENLPAAKAMAAKAMVAKEAGQAPASLQVFGNANSDLRAKRIEPTREYLAGFSHFSSSKQA